MNNILGFTAAAASGTATIGTILAYGGGGLRYIGLGTAGAATLISGAQCARDVF